jgi:hypothetical protein
MSRSTACWALAEAGSTGVVTAQQIEERPVFRSGEVYNSALCPARFLQQSKWRSKFQGRRTINSEELCGSPRR